MKTQSKNTTRKRSASTRDNSVSVPTNLILEAAGEGIYGLDAKGITTFINPAAEKMTGYSAREMVGQCQHKMVHHSKPDGTPYPVEECPIYRAFQDGKVHQVSEEVFWRKDGTSFPVEYVSTPIWKNGKRDGAVVVFKDITERKKLEHTRYLTKVILESAGEGVYGLDIEGRTTFVNPAAERMMGYTAREMVGQCQHKLVHHSKPDGTPYEPKDCPIMAAYLDGRVHNVSNEVFWRKDGTSFPVEYVSTPIRENLKLLGAVVVFKDITERKQAEEEIQQLRRQLELENAYLHEEVLEAKGYGSIIGKSPALDTILRQIEMVAPTDASVLIMGESGTGKELVAREIHHRSARSDRSMIKVNCASIPRELYESEFFGHVKGAFTGAVKDRSGRFELADGGTLFLDEVGEIPLELQSKLLRVLQEGTYERIGDETTRRVDVRIIAATNRDLKEEIPKGRFRQDLYYRLNVFPIEVPPLRSRKEDIPLLARNFVESAAIKFNRPTPKLTQAKVLLLQQYDWPGNVRELQNVIERALITSPPGRLNFDLPNHEGDWNLGKTSATHKTAEADMEVIPELEMKRRERQNIIHALEQSRWQTGGQGGAAEVLGIKQTTLASRIKKMKIKRPD